MEIDFYKIFNYLINFLISPEVQEKLFPVKVAFLVIGFLFLIGIIFCLLKTTYLKWLILQDATEFLTYRPYGAKRITKTWTKILKRLEIADESEYKLAIMEADDLLDNALKRMGYAGQNLEERLSKLTLATLPNLEQVFEAHKVRNSIIRDPDYRLSLDEAKKTLGIYEEAYRHLQILI